MEALPEELSNMPVLYTQEIEVEQGTDVFSTMAKVELTETHAKFSGSPNVSVKIYFRQ